MAGHDALSLTPQTLRTDVLRGWKDIAIYLGKGVRTVQRYELVFRLPVRRILGRARGSVIASRLELEQWVKASPITLASAVQSDSRQVHDDLRTGMSEMRRLCTASYGLKKAVRTQCAVFQSSLQAIIHTLAEPNLGQKMERHKAIATEQKVRARGMIENARQMSDRAVEMRSRTVNVIVSC